MNRISLFPEQIPQILIENIKNLNAVFIFPTDTVLNSWAEYLIIHSQTTGIQAVSMESFIAWDNFKSKYLHATKEGSETIPSILKKFFIQNIILENSQKPYDERFQVIINPKDEYVSNAFSFSSWLYKTLSSLNLLKKKYDENPEYVKDSEDFDYLKLYEEYKLFLKKNNLYEPSWIENINFSADNKKFFLFYPELLEDFGDFEKILEGCDDVNVYYLPENIPSPKAYFYSNSRTELRHTILRIIELVKNKKADWSEIALSVPDIDTYRPYLEREFSEYNIPYVIKSGVSLTKNNAARIFKEISDCYNSNYSYEKVRSLVLDECVPWKEEHTKNREELVRLGNQMRTICSVDEKNIWFVAFNQKKKELEHFIEQKSKSCDENDENLQKLKENLDDIIQVEHFFGKLKHFVDAFFAENISFADILTCWQAFKSFFLQKDENFSNEANNILGRAVCELKEIIQIEQKYADCGLIVKNPFEFFISELESKKYTPQQKNLTGINVFPYKLSALCYFKYQFVIDASQKNLEIPYKKLNFLNATKRSRLHLIEEDKLINADEVFIKLYAKQNNDNYNDNENPSQNYCEKTGRVENNLPSLDEHVTFSVAEITFSGFAIPHSLLNVYENPYNIEEFDRNDYILNEKKFFPELGKSFDGKKDCSNEKKDCSDDSNGSIKETALFITQKQKDEFISWSKKNFNVQNENQKQNENANHDKNQNQNEKSVAPYHVNQKIKDKINHFLVENRTGTDLLTEKCEKTDNIKISARADLEYFFPCPRKWLLKSILKLREDSLDTSLMQPYDMGNLNHKILELFMSSFENKTLPFFDEETKSFKIIEQNSQMINEKAVDFQLDLMPFVEKAILKTAGINECPLVIQELSAQKETIKKDITDFLKVLLLPFGMKTNCKKGYEKMNGIGNCTVFACEKSFTSTEETDNPLQKLQYFGKIDNLLLSPENDWIIIDYKNTKIPSSESISVDENGILQNFQMPVYFKLLYEEKKHDVAAGTFYSINEKTSSSAVDIFMRAKESSDKNAEYVPNKEFMHFAETMNALNVYATVFEKSVNPLETKEMNFTPYTSNSKEDIMNVNVYKHCNECTFKNICRTTYIIGKKNLAERQ